MAETLTNPHRRWPVLSAMGVVQILAWGSSYYLLAVLAKPITADTGWPLAWVVGAMSLAFACGGLASPLTGRLIAEFGGRPVLATGCVLLSLGLAGSALAPNLPAFYLGWAVIGLGMSGALYDPAFATLGRLYKTEARSAITTLTLWGGFASTVCWPFSMLLLGIFDWRGTVLSYAAIHLCISLPLILVLVPKEQRAPLPMAKGKTGRIIAERREFWAYGLMAGMMVVSALNATLISIHVLTLFQAQGLSLTEAVAIGALFGPAQVAGRLVEMAGGGRHHPIWSLLIACISIAAGLVLMALNLGVPGLAMILYGAGNGVFSIVRGALPMSLFGAPRYPVIMGRLARPVLLAQAAAPMLGGALLHAVGPLGTLSVFALLGVIHLCLAIAMLRLWRRAFDGREPAQAD